MIHEGELYQKYCGGKTGQCHRARHSEGGRHPNSTLTYGPTFTTLTFGKNLPAETDLTFHRRT